MKSAVGPHRISLVHYMVIFPVLPPGGRITIDVVLRQFLLVYNGGKSAIKFPSLRETTKLNKLKTNNVFYCCHHLCSMGTQLPGVDQGRADLLQNNCAEVCGRESHQEGGWSSAWVCTRVLPSTTRGRLQRNAGLGAWRLRCKCTLFYVLHLFCFLDFISCRIWCLASVGKSNPA